MEKSKDIAPRCGRRFLPWLLFVMGLAIGTAIGPSVMYAIEAAFFGMRWYGVTFVKRGGEQIGIRSMRIDGRILEHRFVTSSFVTTTMLAAYKPDVKLTFVYQLSADTPPVTASFDLAIKQDWRRHCMAEIVIDANGPIYSGCATPIKSLF